MHIAMGLYNDLYKELKYFAMNHIDEGSTEEKALKIDHANVKLRLEEQRHELAVIQSRIDDALLIQNNNNDIIVGLKKIE